jgi:hypothetical protein
MKNFEYEISRHSADSFNKVVYFCSESGQCSLDEVSQDETRVLTDILNNRGRQGWELIQVSFGKDGLIAFWKRETEGLKKS